MPVRQNRGKNPRWTKIKLFCYIILDIGFKHSWSIEVDYRMYEYYLQSFEVDTKMSGKVSKCEDGHIVCKQDKMSLLEVYFL